MPSDQDLADPGLTRQAPASEAKSRWWQAMPVTEAELRTNGNGFTLLRWVLASTVMFSHGWDLTQPMTGLDPSVPIFGMPISRLAVLLFFSLSGFLVVGGLVRRGVRSFLENRALRLLPGLWVMLLVVPVLMWLLFSDMTALAFFTDQQTLAFIGRNGLLLGGGYFLPGLFQDVPVSGVNGSLWTIPYEVRCYIALALLAAIGLAQPRQRLTVLIMLGIALHLALPEDLVPGLVQTRRLGFAFFLGVLAWLWREKIALSWPAAIIGAAASLFVPAESAAHMPTVQVAFSYLLMVVAFRAPAAIKAASQKLPDYSYGIYIYAFPAQQTALAFGATEPLANIALGAVLMLPFAALSWHFIEAPALGMKRRFSA